MAKGARTIADLERAIATLQRRSREHAQRLGSLETRADLDETWLREHDVKLSFARRCRCRQEAAAASIAKVGDSIGFTGSPLRFGVIDPPLSSARTNSSPVLPSGGSDLAGPGPLSRAREFLRSVRMWASSLFFGRRQTARDGNT